MKNNALARFFFLFAVVIVAVAPIARAHAADELRLLSVTPDGTDVPPGQEIVFQFDHPMVPLGNMNRANTALPVTITPALNCQWRWLDNDKLACRLPGTQRFRPATLYTIQIGTDFTALNGARLSQPVTHTFTTQLPAVSWSTFQRWRSPVAPVYLVHFNLPVTAAAVARSMVFAPDDGGDSVPAQAEPFTQQRTGPLLLPVPGVPGAVAWIEKPQPVKPADAGKPVGEARSVWLISPARALMPKIAYQMTVNPGLVTPLGTLSGSGGTVDNTGFTTYGPFEFHGFACNGDDSGAVVQALMHALSSDNGADGCRPDGVQLAFSAPVSVKTLSAIHWDPVPLSADKLKAAWENYPQWALDHGNARGGSRNYRFGLPFDLAPVRQYHITIPAGVTDQFGRKLAADVSATITTGHLAPELDTPSDNGVLESGEDTVMPVTFANITRLDFTYDTLNAAALNASPNDGDHSSTTVSLLAPFGATPPQDRRLSVPLGVRDFLGGQSGALSGQLDWAPAARGAYQTQSAVFAEVTPWEVLAKVGHFDTLVWLTSLSTGKPVANATLRFYRAPKHQLTAIAPAWGTPLAHAGGLAVLPGASALGTDWINRYNSGAPNWYVAATADKEMALLPLNWNYQRGIGDASGYSISSDTEPQYGHSRSWAITAQGIYRPGATVPYVVFVRGMAPDSLVPAPDLTYSLTISDPTGKSVLTRDGLHLSPFGGISGSLYIPKNATTGRYRINLSWPSGNGTQNSDVGSFLVTEFVPASFKVHTLVEGDVFAPGATVKAQAQARLHAGGPFTQAPVRFSVEVDAEPFAPTTPVASGFNFDVNSDDAPSSVTFYQTKDKLDDAGNARMSTDLPKQAPIVYGRMVVQSSVESERGAWVADRANAIWAARDRFVGLKMDDWLLQSGKSFAIHYLVVDAKGDAQAGSHVQIVLERQQINVVNTANGSGGFTPQQQTTWVKEGDCAGTSSTAPGSCSLTPAHAGTYRIVASVADTRGRKQQTTLDAWSVGPGDVVWPSGAHLTLVPDKNAYHVGDTARVLVQNPYPGARALVTVERYGVLWKKVVMLSSGTPVLQIPIERSFFPGAYLSVSIFSPRVEKPNAADLGKPTLAIGYVALPVVGKGSSLDVAVTPAHTDYKPRQTVDVNVDVKNAQGKQAAHTRLVVAVVDEAVLDLLTGGSDYYDPRKAFYAPPDGPDMLDYSLVSQLITTRRNEMTGKGITPGGGGGGGGPQMRSIFKYTAYWKPDLETDADGHASFSFKLPDNLTGWRVLVVALTPGAAMGLGQATVHANLPLQLGPALPNVVRSGDDFAAGFSLTNRTQQTQSASVTINATGAANGQSASSLSLTPYGHGLAWLRLTPTAPGAITLTATARAGKLGDALRKSIPVEPAGTPATAAAYGSLTAASASVPIKLPQEALAGSGRLVVNLAPTELVNLAAAFKQMRDDPLDTWEVHLSRAVMASDYLTLKDALPVSVSWPDAADAITNSLQHAADFQAPNGGMAFLIPRNDFVSPYLSVYTALAFKWLAAAGHPVPEDVRSALADYLRKNVIQTSDGGDGPGTSLVLRVAAMDALAGDSSVPEDAAAGLLSDLPKLDLFGKALLLQLALANNDTDSAGQVIKAILARSEQTGGSIAFQETESDAYSSLLASPLRSNCAVLDALVTAVGTGGDEAQAIGTIPERLLRWVDARRGTGGGWPNSQENVFCTTAEAHYAKAFEGPVQDLDAGVTAAGQTLGEASFASRRATPKSLNAAAPTQPTDVVIRHSGQGRLYYGVQLEYTLPPSAAPAVDAGFTVQRHYQVEQHGDWVRVGPATVLHRGDIVRVDLTVDAPAERHYVVLTDPLPGAFEAVNHQLATADATTPEQTPNDTTLWFDYGDWPNYDVVTSGFYHRETALDAVRFYADILPAGHYHIVYAAQVIAPGHFTAMPSRIREIYQPDVFGRGSADKVSVAMPDVATGGTAAQGQR